MDANEICRVRLREHLVRGARGESLFPPQQDGLLKTTTFRWKFYTAETSMYEELNVSSLPVCCGMGRFCVCRSAVEPISSVSGHCAACVLSPNVSSQGSDLDTWVWAIVLRTHPLIPNSHCNLCTSGIRAIIDRSSLCSLCSHWQLETSGVRAIIDRAVALQRNRHGGRRAIGPPNQVPPPLFHSETQNLKCYHGERHPRKSSLNDPFTS